MSENVKARMISIKAKAASSKKVQDATRQLKMDMNATFGTESGRRILRHLMGLCGYQQSSVVFDPVNGNVQMDGMLNNEARRGVYLYIRQFMRRDILMYIETHSDSPNDIDDLLS